MLDTRRLLYFVTVAEEGSFTKAAEKLLMAQPPLSQQIKLLEDEVGFRLFERAKRKSPYLTAEGRAFLPEAKKTLESVERLGVFAQQQSAGSTGHLSIGYIASFGTERFARMIRGFARENPGVQITLLERSTGKQIPAFDEGLLDVGFMRKWPHLPSGFSAKPILKQEMKLAVPSDHIFAKRKQIDWKDLKDQKIVLVDSKIVSSDYYAEFFTRLDQAGVVPQLSQTAVGIAGQVWLVSSGQGVAPVPVTDELKIPGVVWLDLPKNSPRYDLEVVWRKGARSPLVEKFVKYTLGFWKV